MKRPQFSLRLMLLVMALCAAMFAWKRATWDKERAERDEQLMELNWKMEAMRIDLENYEQENSPTRLQAAANRIRAIEIPSLKKRIDALKQ